MFTAGSEDAARVTGGRGVDGSDLRPPRRLGGGRGHSGASVARPARTRGWTWTQGRDQEAQGRDRDLRQLRRGRGRRDEDSRGQAGAGLGGTERGRSSLAPDLETVAGHSSRQGRDSASSTWSGGSGTRS